jgi:hypothetical protein
MNKNAGQESPRQTWSQEARERQAARAKASWEKRNALKSPKGAGQGESNPGPAQPESESAASSLEVTSPNQTEQVKLAAAEQLVSTVFDQADLKGASQTQPVADPDGSSKGSGSTTENSQLAVSSPAQVISAAIAPIGAIQLAAALPAGSIEDMAEEQLDKLIAGLWTGYKCNRLMLAVALHEKKTRLSKPGCKGEWSPFLRSSGIPRTTADRLIQGYELCLKISPLLRNAAEKAHIDLMNPAVVAMLQNLHAEVFDLVGPPPQEKIDKWVEALAKAAQRRPSLGAGTATDRPDQEEGTEDDESERPEDSTGGANKERKHPVTLAFTAAELRKYKSLLQECGDGLDLERTEEIVLEALRLAKGGPAAGAG